MQRKPSHKPTGARNPSFVLPIAAPAPPESPIEASARILRFRQRLRPELGDATSGCDRSAATASRSEHPTQSCTAAASAPLRRHENFALADTVGRRRSGPRAPCARSGRRHGCSRSTAGAACSSSRPCGRAARWRRPGRRDRPRSGRGPPLATSRFAAGTSVMPAM